MKNVFKISYDTFDEGGWANASGFGPLTTDMPFIAPAMLDRELKFWELNPRPPGIDINARGKNWPDILGNGGGALRFWVSDKVLNSLATEQISIREATAMPIAKIAGKTLQKKQAPRYFVLQAVAGIEVDYAASGIPLDETGKPVLSREMQLHPPKNILKLSSWNGSDLFSWSNRGGNTGLELFCTERVIEIAKRDGWTNVKFEPIETV
jgi:hypothetical protein